MDVIILGRERTSLYEGYVFTLYLHMPLLYIRIYIYIYIHLSIYLSLLSLSNYPSIYILFSHVKLNNPIQKFQAKPEEVKGSRRIGSKPSTATKPSPAKTRQDQVDR